jgi:hypothetical protein
MKAIQDPLEEALDAALEMTFPASDPIAVYMDESVAVEIIANRSQGKASIDANTYGVWNLRMSSTVADALTSV